MLAHVGANSRRVVVPAISSLDVATWTEADGGHVSAHSASYLTFDAEFKWTSALGDAAWVPMMPGGLFGISASCWAETGGYDAQMSGWGGENIDQSLRIWRCACPFRPMWWSSPRVAWLGSCGSRPA